MGGAHAPVLRKANSAVRKELACFNLVCSCFNWLAKFPALLFINRCLQILNFGRALSHEDDQSNIRDPSHPGKQLEAVTGLTAHFARFGMNLVEPRTSTPL